MSIHVALRHQTEYRYDRPVALSPHIVRLRPAPHCRTPILAYSLLVEPEKHFINWQQDPFGNFLARLVFPEKTDRLRVDVDLVADLTVINPFDFFLEEEGENFPFRYPEGLARDLAQYLEIRESGPLLGRWLAGVDRSPRRTVDFLVDVNQRLQSEISYTIRMEPGVHACEETLSRRRGSCRDSGWLLVQILRHLGLAARFVSGYLVQLKPDEKSLDGPPGPTTDFTDLHAWAEVFVPGGGWIGLDPTSGLFAGEGHIPLACTPEPSSAAPITGASEPAESELHFLNDVTRIHEDPRVTKPYTDEQWAAIDALGEAVDADLAAHDVRLTMGGEPTFVSIDDREGAEWNSAALGPNKQRLAGDLLKRLQQHFAPDALLFHGQGKWYPGEPLPRWALSCHWRADGEPLWTERALLADKSKPYGATTAHAARFTAALARRFGVPEELAVPGYEDTLYYVWKEGTLPANVDPTRADLTDPAERRRLVELLSRGLDSVTGYALPLRWAFRDDGSEGWLSSRWSFRRSRMYLVPGDSAMGYRLPLDSLPWLALEEREQVEERSQFQPLPPLPQRTAPEGAEYRRVERPGPGEQRREQTLAGPLAAPSAVGAEEERGLGSAAAAEARAAAAEARGLARTAICIEARAGLLYCFLPPMRDAVHFIALIAAVEDTAAELGLPVIVEGYEPPRDSRLRSFHITPDPGVIEVNVHPVSSWSELRDNTRVLYEEARLTRLSTEKFMLDGRHTGSGGGNHVTIGGATPADSPMLRRPDLLRSLVTYWQNHPSLSYLFSGLFVGPTSQAPRVDEARDDTLYELGIAFQQMPQGEVVQPWLVDRLLRNLLVDLTGNTHRAEFCIDKLYNPETATGRLGLLEFRSFEMPPHARMSAVQQLLLRALIARFWRQPYRRPLVRWGTELHDRFLLPHYVWRDFSDVVCELSDAGYGFDLSWFAPFYEMRFPQCGSVQVGDLELELRTAIEPWNVLGEEVASGGTARYVDSSVERMQVKVRGMTGERHVVTCNGRRLPLRPTETQGDFVAGVRYRAWQPPSCLHPTIGVHAPLVLDVVDTWSGRSLGGCTYHVAHPGGRSYDTFPLNAFEAEARRMARFWPHGHTPGRIEPPAEERNPDFPWTLDLRYRDLC